MLTCFGFIVVELGRVACSSAIEWKSAERGQHHIAIRFRIGQALDLDAINLVVVVGCGALVDADVVLLQNRFVRVRDREVDVLVRLVIPHSTSILIC